MSTVLQRMARSAQAGASAITVAITALVMLGLAALAHAGRPCEDRPLETGTSSADWHWLSAISVRWRPVAPRWCCWSAPGRIWASTVALVAPGLPIATTARPALCGGWCTSSTTAALPRPSCTARVWANFPRPAPPLRGGGVPLAALVQARCRPLADNGRVAELHEPRYSTVVTPGPPATSRANQWR